MRFLYLLGSAVIGALILVGLVVSIQVAFFFFGIDGETSAITSIDVLVILWFVGVFLTETGPVLVRNEGRVRLRAPVQDAFVGVPMLLGIILGSVSTPLFWLGFWLSITCIVLIVWGYSSNNRQENVDD